MISKGRIGAVLDFTGETMSVVESLLNLYRVDGQVRSLRSRLTQAERYLANQEKLLADLQRQLHELQSRRRQHQATIANSEVEIKAFDQRLEKLRNDLNSASTNKQHQAVLTEMNAIKAKRAEVEDQMLIEMEAMDKLSESFGSIENQSAEREKVRERARADLEERRNDVGARLAELETERAHAAALVPDQVLALFEKLADDFDGEAMSAIDEIDRRNREYACGACNMHLPFELMSQLMCGADVVHRCPSCTRILFVQDKSKVTLSGKR